MKKWKKSVLLSIFIVLYICLELVNLAGLELAVARPNLSSNKSTLNRRSPLEGCLMRTALSVDAVSEAAYNIGFVKGGILSLPAPLHYAASIPKSGLEIKNRCSKGPQTRKTLHRFPSLGLKSRIDARKGPETGKTLHRFPSLSLKSRIDASWRENPDRRPLRE